MKGISAILVFISFFFVSSVEEINQNESNKLVLKAIYRGNYSLPTDKFSNKSDSIYYFLIDVKLINNTNKLVEFITFSCTPIGNIVLKSNTFNICPNNCINNGYFPVKLKTGQEFSIPVILEASKKNADNCIKIGWALLTEDNTKSVDNYLEVLLKAKTKYENVIWSNEICLDRVGGNPIEIY
jgi:hypothetical protein